VPLSTSTLLRGVVMVSIGLVFAVFFSWFATYRVPAT
jgi:hypothetical protein